MAVQRFRVTRSSFDGESVGHVELSDLQGLLNWVKATGHPCILDVEDGTAPSIEIYDDYRE
jgi:hypothetical protein